MKKPLLVVATLMLAGCVTRPQLTVAVPVSEDKMPQLCALAIYQNGQLLNDYIAQDAVVVTDKGDTFSYQLVGKKDSFVSMPLVLEAKSGMKSLKDSNGYFYARGTGTHTGMYTVAHSATNWAAVFNCKRTNK